VLSAVIIYIVFSELKMSLAQFRNRRVASVNVICRELTKLPPYTD